MSKDEKHIKYSTYPIPRWSTGRFKAVDSVLTIRESDREEFETILSELPPIYTRNVTELLPGQQMPGTVVQPGQATQGGAHTGLVAEKDREIADLKAKLEAFEGAGNAKAPESDAGASPDETPEPPANPATATGGIKTTPKSLTPNK